MGLRRIGRRIGRGLRRVSRGLGRVTKFGSKVLGAVTKPLSAVMKPLQSVLGKLPFGNLVMPFAQAFMGNPLALMNPSVLGAAGGLLQGAGNVGQLTQLAQAVAPMQAFASPEGRMNLLQMTAQRHAQIMFPGLG